MATTFGIEEEFVLLDRRLLIPVDLGRQAVDELGRASDGTVAREFFGSQVEFATPVCETYADAEDALLGFRRRLAEWAGDAGVVAAGTGTPFRIAPHAAVTSDERYERIAADVGAVAGEHQINGLHVHVGIVDRDTRVRTSNALRAWLPVLLALSGNSPFWKGRDTGFDSWRAIHSRRWTTYGIPPRFRDEHDYDRTVATLMGLGATSDDGCLNWNIRLSSNYPTIEVRVCDAQLDPSASLALAVIIRALVERAGTGGRQDAAFDAWADSALWHAARYGIGATLVHPVSGRPKPAAEILGALRRRIAPALHDRRERVAVRAFLDRTANGATLQRRAAALGPDALADLYGGSLATTTGLPTVTRRSA